jgi:glutathione S-transferase
MILSAPAIILTAAVTVLAALVCLGIMFMVGRTRSKYKVDAPAMTGAPEVERALRVQGNTTEQIVIFLPLLWVAALYFQGWWAPVLGLVWCLGRIIYAVGYMKSPAGRSAGFMIAGVATVALLILAIIGIVQAWIAAHAF